MNEDDSVDEMPSTVEEMDYISEGQTSDTLPIRRIGANSQKIDLFKIFPQIPTNNDATTEKTEETTTTSMPLFNFTMPASEQLLHEENMEVNDTASDGDAENVQGKSYQRFFK